MQVESQIRVDDLAVGDTVDLENDKYADPDRDDTWLAQSYSTVENVEILEDGVLVQFNNAAAKFPFNHLVYQIR
jgi:hypothetical protein